MVQVDGILIRFFFINELKAFFLLCIIVPNFGLLNFGCVCLYEDRKVKE